MMRESFLKLLTCHDCGSDLTIEEIYNKKNKEIINGIVGCNCCNYPLLDGILVYKRPSFKDKMANTAYIVERLRRGNIDDAKALPLKGGKMENSLLELHSFLASIGGFKRPLYPLLTMIRKRKQRIYNKLSKDISFFEIMDILEPNPWGDYLKHRFSSQTLWSFYPFIPLIEKKKDRISNV